MSYDLVLDPGCVSFDMAAFDPPDPAYEITSPWAYSDLGTADLKAMTLTNPLIAGPASVLFWFKQDTVGEGGTPINGAIEIVHSGGGAGYVTEFLGDVYAPGLTLNAWHHYGVTADGTNHRLYLDGVLASTVANVAGLTGDIVFGNAADFLGSPMYPTHIVAAPMVFGRVLSLAEIAALAGKGIHWPPERPNGAWPGEVPFGSWRGQPSSNRVPNIGGLARTPRTAAVGNPGPTTYPPVRSFYRLPGAPGSFLRAFGPRIANMLFPGAGGALGSITIRLWIRRPPPVVDTGTFLWINRGDAWLRGVIDEGKVRVTVDDGNGHEVTGISADVTGLGYDWRWVSVVISVDVPSELIRVWTGPDLATGFTVAIGTIDLLEDLTPEPEGDTFIGTNDDDTAYIDIDVGNIGIWAYAWLEEDVPWIVEDPYRDPRTPEPRRIPPRTPPVIVWVDPLDPERVVPDGGDTPEGEETTPLVPRSLSVESFSIPSDFNAWFSGDHRIGVYSTGWWPESAHDPDLWTLAFVTGSDADVFGECPRVVAVTLRSDGALVLDLDARCVPGIGYTLTGPDDISATATLGFWRIPVTGTKVEPTLNGYGEPDADYTAFAEQLVLGSSLLFWMRVIQADEGGYAVEVWTGADPSAGVSQSFSMYIAAGGQWIADLVCFNYLMEGVGSPSPGQPYNTWVFCSIETDAGTGAVKLYHNASLVVTTTGAAPDPGGEGAAPAWVRFKANNLNAIDFTNVMPLNRALTADERIALTAAGPGHNFTEAFDDGDGHVWAGGAAAYYWPNGALGNQGTAGTPAMVLGGDASVESEVP